MLVRCQWLSSRIWEITTVTVATGKTRITLTSELLLHARLATTQELGEKNKTRFVTYLLTITRLRARLGRRDWCIRFGSLSLSSKRFVSNCKRVTSAVAETCVLTNVNPTQPRSHSGDNIFFLFFFSGIQSICPHLVIILFRSTATFASNNLHQFKEQLKIVVSLCHITQPPSDSFSGDK